MGWFDSKKDEGTKGKSETTPPDEKKTEQSKSEADLLVEKLGASLDARLKPLADKVEAVATWQKNLEEVAKKTTPARTEGTNDTTKRVSLADASMDDAAEEEWKKQNILPAYVEMAKTNARLTERETLDALGPEFDFLKPDIRKIFDDTPIQRKAGADYGAYCSNVVKMVIGDAAMKAGLKVQGQGDKRRFYLEDGTSKGNTGETIAPTDAETLRKLHIDPAEFAKANEVTH